MSDEEAKNAVNQAMMLAKEIEDQYFEDRTVGFVLTTCIELTKRALIAGALTIADDDIENAIEILRKMYIQFMAALSSGLAAAEMNMKGGN